MNKLTQIILSVAGILVIITCIVVMLRKQAHPSIELIQEWEKAKQEAVDKTTQELVEKNKELEEKLQKVEIQHKRMPGPEAQPGIIGEDY